MYFLSFKLRIGISILQPNFQPWDTGNSFLDLLCKCAVRYIAKLEDDTIFDKKGFDGEAPLDFITDEGRIWKLLAFK